MPELDGRPPAATPGTARRPRSGRTMHNTARRRRPPDTATQRRGKPPLQPGHKGLARGPGDATPLHRRTGGAPGGWGISIQLHQMCKNVNE